jgi:hypothetical protein
MNQGLEKETPTKGFHQLVLNVHRQEMVSPLAFHHRHATDHFPALCRQTTSEVLESTLLLPDLAFLVSRFLYHKPIATRRAIFYRACVFSRLTNPNSYVTWLVLGSAARRYGYFIPPDSRRVKRGLDLFAPSEMAPVFAVRLVGWRHHCVVAFALVVISAIYSLV